MRNIDIDGKRLGHLRFANDTLMTDNLKEARGMMTELKLWFPQKSISNEQNKSDVLSQNKIFGSQNPCGEKQSEIKYRISLGWAAFGRVTNNLQGCLPIMLKEPREKMESAILKITRKDKISNTEIRNRRIEK